MNKKKFYLMICLMSINCFSQNNEVGIYFGGTNYIGDIGPTRYVDPGRFEESRKEFKSDNYAFGILYKKNFNDRIAARVQLNYAKIGSNDNWKGAAAFRKERGKRFKNTISTEIGLGVDFNFFNFDTKIDVFQISITNQSIQPCFPLLGPYASLVGGWGERSLELDHSFVLHHVMYRPSSTG